jgi:uncharacterized protein with FMN-binding domain
MAADPAAQPGAVLGRYNPDVLKPRTKAPAGLLALGSAAIIAVYSVGYARTRAPGVRFAETPAIRRPAQPPPGRTAPTGLPVAPPVAESRGASVAPATQAEARPALRARPEAPLVSPATPKPTRVAPQPALAVASEPEASTAASTRAEATTVDSAAASPDPAPPASKSPYRDGTYSGWGTSRHGDIQATVVIEDGRIASATITQCLTRYSCSIIDRLQGQVVTRQSPEVDYVSGATQSTDAFYYAVVEALSKAK